MESLAETYASEDIRAAFEARAKAEIRSGILAGRRLNGRALDEVMRSGQSARKWDSCRGYMARLFSTGARRRCCPLSL